MKHADQVYSTGGAVASEYLLPIYISRNLLPYLRQLARLRGLEHAPVAQLDRAAAF